MDNTKVGARHSGQDLADMQKVHDIAVGQGAACAPAQKATDNALKALSETTDELVVGNHIVLFGGRDLTGIAYGKNADGSMGEYFSKTTELESEYTKTGRLYVDFEHGRDPDETGNTKHNILGYVDWKSAIVDDEGVFVKRVLYRRNKFVKMLEPLIKAGLIGNSSESVGGQAIKSDNGEITKWPLMRDTLTVNPMEPRMLSENVLEAVKALSSQIPALKSLIPSKDTALTVEDVQTKSTNQPIRETYTMDELDIKAITEKAIVDAFAARDAAEAVKTQKAADDKAAEERGYKQALEDVRSNKAPAFNTKTELGFSEEKDAVPAFKHWMQTGQTNGGLIPPDGSFNAIPEAKAAWNVTTGASGAFLVPDPLYNQIIAKRDVSSWIRQVPVQVFQTPADHLLVPRENTKHTNFVQTAEAVAYNEDEGTVSQKDLIQYKYTKMTKVNEEFLMYNTTNWESWFAGALGRAAALTENTIFTTGTGTGEAEGVLIGATTSGITLATVDILLPAELSALVGKLGQGYNVQGEVAFLMANATKWYLKGTTSNPFTFVGTPQGGDFYGIPAVVNDVLAPYTTESDKPVIFGNFNYYGVIEKPGMIVQRNPYLYMATGQIGIFASIFRGGGVLQAEAFYYLTTHA